MRKALILATTAISVLAVFGPAFVTLSEASAPADSTTENVAQDTPGSRCTRLRYGPIIKAKKGAAITGGGPGTRCLRLATGPRKGKFLPNTPPKVGLSSSTSYLGPEAGSEVKLDTIVCDLEDDNVLYTYSVTAGRITGDGPNARWDLSGASRPGSYTVSVEVDDGCGCVSFASREVTVGG